MKKLSFLCLFFLSLPILLPPALFGFEIHVPVHDRYIKGEGGTNPNPVIVTLKNGGGQVKGTYTTIPDSGGGSWDVELWDNVVVMPGDTVEVDHLGNLYSAQVANVTITGLNIATDVVSGRIRPRKHTARVHAEQSVLTWGGMIEEVFDSSAVTDPDGRYRIDMTSAGNLRRRAQLFVGYFEGDFRIYREIFVPYLHVMTRNNGAIFFGPPGKTYKATLLSGAGKVRGSSPSTLGGFQAAFMGPIGIFQFFKRSGAPTWVQPGNRLRISGKWGFTTLVKPLEISVLTAFDVVDVTTVPGYFVEIVLDRYDAAGNHLDTLDVVRKAGTDGTVRHRWPGETFNAGDRVMVLTQDSRGNTFEAKAMAP